MSVFWTESAAMSDAYNSKIKEDQFLKLQQFDKIWQQLNKNLTMTR